MSGLVPRAQAILSERDHQAADVPHQQPVRRHHHRDEPQACAERAADIADGIGPRPERRRHHRRGGGNQPKHQQVEGEGEIEREGCRGELRRAQAAHQQDVGRLDHLLGHVCEDQRPGEREHRAQLNEPRTIPVGR